MKTTVAAMTILAIACASASAAVTATTVHGLQSTSLDGMIKTGDLISGLIATELPGDLGWHGANSNPADRLPAFTDDAGILPVNGFLTGLLNDFPPAGEPTKKVQYNLGGPKDIASIGILSGNNGRDGRIFSTTVIYYSNNGTDFNLLGYFQSDPSGTLNGPATSPQYGSTYVTISDNASSTLLAGVTNLQVFLYGVDNTGGQMRDPFDGLNPFTGVDDTLSAPNTSPLILELDVVAVPEPAALTLLALGALGLRRRRSI